MLLNEIEDIGTISYTEGLVLRSAGAVIESSILLGSEINNNEFWISNLVEDLTPQLGGDLDGQSTFDILDIVNITYSGDMTGGDAALDNLTIDNININGNTIISTVDNINITAADNIALTATGNEISADCDQFIVDTTDFILLEAAKEVDIRSGDGEKIFLRAGDNQTNYIEISEDATQPMINFVASNGWITAADGTINFDDEHLTTTGNLTAGNYTAANLLTACATNAGELDFTAAAKKLDVEDDAVVSQDYSSDAAPTFAGLDCNGILDMDVNVDVDPSTIHSSLDLIGVNAATPIVLSNGTTIGLQFVQSYRPVAAGIGFHKIYGCFGSARAVRDNITFTIDALAGMRCSCLTVEGTDGGAITVNRAASVWASTVGKDADDTITAAFGFYSDNQTNGDANWGFGVNTNSYVNANFRLGDAVVPTDACEVNGVTVLGDGGATNYTEVSATGNIAQKGTGRFIESSKFKITAIGGYAIKLTNQTGGNSVQGQTVKSDTATDDAVILTAADDNECFGVFLDAGIADGSEAWIVVAGIADVAMGDDEAATHGNWVETNSAEAGYADATSGTPSAAPQHFNEIGHCIESVAAGGGGTHILARCVLHFN